MPNKIIELLTEQLLLGHSSATNFNTNSISAIVDVVVMGQTITDEIFSGLRSGQIIDIIKISQRREIVL